MMSNAQPEKIKPVMMDEKAYDHDFATLIRLTLLELRNHSPFLGVMATEMWIAGPTESVPTIAVSPKGTVVYNEKWLKSISIGEMIGVLIHEALHVALDAWTRFKGKDGRMANWAHDFAINDIIKTTLPELHLKRKQSAARTIKISLPDGGLYDTKYSGWSGEEIYVDLDKMVKAKAEEYKKHIENALRQQAQSDGTDFDREQRIKEKLNDSLVQALKEIGNKKEDIRSAFEQIKLSAERNDFRDILLNLESSGGSLTHGESQDDAVNNPLEGGQKSSSQGSWDNAGSKKQDASNDSFSHSGNDGEQPEPTEAQKKHQEAMDKMVEGFGESLGDYMEREYDRLGAEEDGVKPEKTGKENVGEFRADLDRHADEYIDTVTREGLEDEAMKKDEPQEEPDQPGEPGQDGDKPQDGKSDPSKQDQGKDGQEQGDDAQEPGKEGDQGNQPGKEGQGDEGADGQQPGGGNDPGDGNQPGQGDQPGEGNQPGSGNQPGQGDQPGQSESAQPGQGQGGQPSAGQGGQGQPGQGQGGQPSQSGQGGQSSPQAPQGRSSGSQNGSQPGQSNGQDQQPGAQQSGQGQPSQENGPDGSGGQGQPQAGEGAQGSEQAQQQGGGASQQPNEPMTQQRAQNNVADQLEAMEKEIQKALRGEENSLGGEGSKMGSGSNMADQGAWERAMSDVGKQIGAGQLQGDILLDDNDIAGNPYKNETPEQTQERHRQTLASAVQLDRQAGGTGWGKLPAWAQKQIEGILNPPLTFDRHIKKEIGNYGAKSMTTFKKPNKRNSFAPNRPLLPGKKKNESRVYILLDTSGSMFNPEDLDNLRHAYGLIKRLAVSKGLEVMVVHCDADVTRVMDTREVMKEINSNSFGLTGLGGSDFRPGFEFIWKEIRQNDPLYGAPVIVFTDGGITVPDRVPFNVRSATLWVTVQGEQPPTTEWGTHVVMDGRH